MVAYSFQKQFAPPILSGRKRQTIRAQRRGRSRHAREGEELQLYTGLRTRHAKLIGRAECLGTSLISFDFLRDKVVIDDGDALRVIDDAQALHVFAMGDGFEGWEHLVHFWAETHEAKQWDGVIIYWGDLR